MVKSETLYRKVGRRYVPVQEHEYNFRGFPEGFSLTYCKPGSTLTRFKINPSNMELQAALTTIEDNICKIVEKAFEIKRPDLTKNQIKMWDDLVKTGFTRYLSYGSIQSISQEILLEIKKLCEQ